MSPRGLPTESTTLSNSDHVKVKKKYKCRVQGCGKIYTRPEHLKRHSVNHKGGPGFICPNCSTAFHRKDLFERHVLRHKEKDDKAGGEGLGELQTRKKLWANEQGTLVRGRNQGKKRSRVDERLGQPPPPSSSAPSIPGSGTTPIEQNGESIRIQYPGDTVSEQDGEYIQLQENSDTENEPNGENIQLHDSGDAVSEQNGEYIQLQDDMWEHGVNSAPQGWDADPSNFLCNASWGTEPLQTDFGSFQDLPFDNSFKPDTAMSFNQTYTTASYFDWLFENDGHQPADVTQLILHEGPVVGMGSNEHESVMRTAPQVSGFGTINLGTSTLPRDSHAAAFTPWNVQNEASLNGNHVGASLTSHGLQQYSNNNTIDSANFERPNVSSMYPILRGVSPSGQNATSQIRAAPEPPLASPSTQLLPDTRIVPPVTLPVIYGNARKKIIYIVTRTHLSMPDGSKVKANDALLSLPSLQAYSDLFFTRFNLSYPLIHQPTFDPDEVHTYLLMSVLLLGATYYSKDAHLMAVCIHDIMRPLIHSSKDFGTKPEFWMLQTILLVECFGKNRAGEKQHDMSHLYHGLLINLIRRSDCQSAYVPPYDENVHDLEKHWRLSVEGEQKRRLALLCFMWDTQHAVLFSQSLCMNASELKLTLPWDNTVWEADTASRWLVAYKRAAAPSHYLSVLKMYTKPSATRPPQHLNALSRILILHGLMSISWDFHRRDKTSLSLSVNNSSRWRNRMAKCYLSWNEDFETYTSSVLRSLQWTPPRYNKFLRFTVANMAAYHTAQMILDVDIVDMQICAGARHIIGRPVSQVDRARSKTKIEMWIVQGGGKNAATATWHAAKLLQTGFKRLEKFACDEFHYSWCLYLATLMCWTFHDAATKRQHLTALHPAETQVSVTQDPSNRFTSTLVSGGGQMGIIINDVNEDQDWHSNAGTNAFVSRLTKLDPSRESFVKVCWEVAARHETRGLLRSMVKHLSTVRWAVVREGMIVLRGLLE